jgi:TP901-1 family phage major tail protein
MGEVMQGKDRILLVRRLDEAATKKAMKPLFQIEHEWEFSRESSKQKMALRMLFLV